MLHFGTGSYSVPLANLELAVWLWWQQTLDFLVAACNPSLWLPVLEIPLLLGVALV